MPERPNLPNGYLGQQPKFDEFKLKKCSHDKPEFDCDSNSLNIKLQFAEDKKVKVTHQLIECEGDKEVSEFVFTQMDNNTITFCISLPCSGYYKFQVFALPVSEDSKSLPNVFNYLINCTQALHPCFPYPKQYAQWKDGCYLDKPLCLHPDMPLKKVDWGVKVPGANGVAVVAGGEWFHLKKNGDTFEGTSDLTPFKGKDTKVTLNANLGPDETKYATLLEYKI